MSITIDFGAGDILERPSDLRWTDRHQWDPLVQRSERTLTGGEVVETSERLSGRSITLQAGPSYGWADTALVEALRTRFDAGDAALVLTIGATGYNVLLDRERGGMSARARKGRPAEVRPQRDVWFLTLRFRSLD